MKNAPILYVEDEENDVFFMERAFHQAGIVNPLVIAADGQDAIDYIFGTSDPANPAGHPMPALMLLDLNMPKLSGIEVLKKIRTTAKTASLPVIVVSSSAQEADTYRAYLQGANGYLVKPSNPDELLAMVKSIKDFWLTHNRTVVGSIKLSEHSPRAFP